MDLRSIKPTWINSVEKTSHTEDLLLRIGKLPIYGLQFVGYLPLSVVQVPVITGNGIKHAPSKISLQSLKFRWTGISFLSQVSLFIFCTVFLIYFSIVHPHGSFDDITPLTSDSIIITILSTTCVTNCIANRIHALLNVRQTLKFWRFQCNQVEKIANLWNVPELVEDLRKKNRNIFFQFTFLLIIPLVCLTAVDVIFNALWGVENQQKNSIKLINIVIILAAASILAMYSLYNYGNHGEILSQKRVLLIKKLSQVRTRNLRKMECKEVKSFIQKVQNCDLNITAGHFFVLHRTFVLSILSVLMTLLIVMAQFRNQDETNKYGILNIANFMYPNLIESTSPPAIKNSTHVQDLLISLGKYSICGLQFIGYLPLSVVQVPFRWTGIPFLSQIIIMLSFVIFLIYFYKLSQEYGSLDQVTSLTSDAFIIMALTITCTTNSIINRLRALFSVRETLKFWSYHCNHLEQISLPWNAPELVDSFRKENRGLFLKICALLMLPVISIFLGDLVFVGLLGISKQEEIKKNVDDTIIRNNFLLSVIGGTFWIILREVDNHSVAVKMFHQKVSWKMRQFGSCATNVFSSLVALYALYMYGNHGEILNQTKGKLFVQLSQIRTQNLQKMERAEIKLLLQKVRNCDLNISAGNFFTLRRSFVLSASLDIYIVVEFAFGHDFNFNLTLEILSVLMTLLVVMAQFRDQDEAYKFGAGNSANCSG
ncbi:putative gustatory receptor 28b [Folsomia candida]|uniref:Putative gustatory receptor 28b n=1 Tax=Folsomia candida TaxID=158441 RepID=A0A226F7P3_FOLCA|nr:putative gustatory receptor 28b [Folsomia candida]